MSADELQPYELMQKVVDFLELESVPYRIVGSLASILYGEPRFTNDVDILIDMPLSKADALCDEFPLPDFYVSADAVRQSITLRHQFNIIHLPSGLKVDMILTDGTEFDQQNIQQGRRLVDEGVFDALFASPENVILKKLFYFKEGGSDKHLRDISGVFQVQDNKIDQAFLNQWAEKMGVSEELELVRRKLREREE